jgi:DNA-3-methyladenine glycosylase II
MLSLDVDARGYEAVAARDPVVARVLAAAAGLRPPLFHSPYEAAAWCVLSLRWNTPAGGRGAGSPRPRARPAGRGGGRRDGGLPHPGAAAGRLRVRGRAAGEDRAAPRRGQGGGRGPALAEEIRRADPEEAMARLRRIPGIGPFSASLIVLRASGVCDVSVEEEPRLAAIVGRLYGLPGPATAADMRRIGESWRPFRTWVGVLLRAASNRVPQAA